MIGPFILAEGSAATKRLAATICAVPPLVRSDPRVRAGCCRYRADPGDVRSVRADRLLLLPFVPDFGWAIALLFLRSALSQMDVPTRSSCVMVIVTPAERPAAASVTAVPRSLASAVSPFLAGWMLGLSTFGWPLLVAGGVKIAYDLLLLAMFRRIRPPEEERPPR